MIVKLKNSFTNEIRGEESVERIVSTSINRSCRNVEGQLEDLQKRIDILENLVTILIEFSPKKQRTALLNGLLTDTDEEVHSYE